jgi:hypothetical protein
MFSVCKISVWNEELTARIAITPGVCGWLTVMVHRQSPAEVWSGSADFLYFFDIVTS